ncbi:MAG: RNA polymerase sigma factor [Negativicutes bacterium]|nr:RNA polymerase sigma factor [Negativicutes bacterium]
MSENKGKVGEKMQQEDILIGKAQAGDREALNELVSFYWQPIYRFITYKTASPEDAQELTQETFFRAFRALPTFRKTEASFKTYLSQIALNLIRDHWRKKGRSPALVDIADCQEAATETDQPDIEAINQERRETIAGMLQKLPVDQRQAVELRIIAGLPVRETAEAMGKSEAAVKMLQQRALKSLRTLLSDDKTNEYGTDWR